jgi:hypothetical protein
MGLQGWPFDKIPTAQPTAFLIIDNNCFQTTTATSIYI